jgi:hopene-associated glycosyltransferase HpnB
VSDSLEWIAFAVLAFWVFLALDIRRWWPGSLTLSGAESQPGTPSGAGSSIYAIIPARNEARTLYRTLPALLAQGDALAGLLVVDDRSADDTPAVVHKLAAMAPCGESVRVLEAGDLPEGWSGKIHALQAGINAVERLEAEGKPACEWLLFTDADILHGAHSVHALEKRAREGDFDLVSVMVRLRTSTFWEKLLVPPFVYFFQLLYPFRRVQDPESRVAAAAGGCILLRRSVLERVGGLEALRGAVIDDVTLARHVKGAGGRCWLGTDPEMLSIRAYEKLADIANMVARTAFCQLGYRYSLVVITLLFLGVFFVSPPVLLLLSAAAASWPGGALAGAAWALESATLLPVVRHQRVSSIFAATLPAASALYGAMTALSAWRHFTGRGVSWRGRVLSASSSRQGTGDSTAPR